ncbi:hypothetical protein [Phycobacter sp. K97]|uniref:hypothetical protein n=1 Tax=Phycobacter sedimenti TaxID=3133977 RepID=UPI00311E94C6
MFDFTVLFAIYLFLTAAALVLTYIEGEENRKETKGYRAIGMVLCLVWPVVVVAILAFKITLGINNWLKTARLTQ